MPDETPRAATYANAGPWLAALSVVALVAFWPTYLSQAPSASSAYTHAHAATAALWMLILIVQPLLILRRRRAWHRAVGRATYVAAPLVLLSIVLLAHSRIRGAAADAWAIQSYVLYLQVSLAVLFAGLYGLGVALRRNTALHARAMVCTALTLVDPVAIRLMFWIAPEPAWNYQWFTFGLTDAMLAAMIWRDRRYGPGRALLSWVLAAFVLAQVPALFALTERPAWQAFARWFAALPLT